MRQPSDDLPPSSLRGRLCEVFFGALGTEMVEPLLHRLGDKAALDDALFGAAEGLKQLRTRLDEWVAFLADHEAHYERTTTIVGADRDVTEGLFELREGGHRLVPVAVLMERKREREVGLRVYCGTSVFGLGAKGPTPTDATAQAPTFVSDLLSALEARDAKQVALATEEDATLRDAAGVEHTRDAIVRVLGGVKLPVTAIADDGRTCAIEATIGSRLALLIFQRGDSGLVRSLRVYSEL